MHIPSQTGGEYVVEVVRMRSQRHSECRLLGCVAAKLRQVSVERRLSTSKADAETVICVELIEPINYPLNTKPSRHFRREAIGTSQVTNSRQRD
jgi:hypothetical protein